MLLKFAFLDASLVDSPYLNTGIFRETLCTKKQSRAGLYGWPSNSRFVKQGNAQRNSNILWYWDSDGP